MTLWTDYIGSTPYVDYGVTCPDGYATASEETRYLAAFGAQARQTMDGQGDPVEYFHGDLIRSTMLTTDRDSAPVSPVTTYTAFGEFVDPAGNITGEPPADFPRYAYAGGWGYETGFLTLYGANPDLPPITLQHLGERWYQPDIGRFVQRDPVGIMGGLNVYLYCDANPLVCVDFSGLWSWSGFWGGLVTGAGMGALGGSAFGPVGGVVGGVTGGIVGGIYGGTKTDSFREGAKYGGALGGFTGVAAGKSCVSLGARLLGPRGPIFGRGSWVNSGKSRIGWSWKAKEGWKWSVRWKNWHWDWF